MAKFLFRTWHWNAAVSAGLMKPRTNGQGISLAMKGKPMPEAKREAVRLGMQRAVAEGRQKTVCPGGIVARAPYERIDGSKVALQGSWEFKFAAWLDGQQIGWERPKDSFEYEFEGSIKRYTPDFYLPDFDLFVEVKGYETDKDRAKWKQFPRKLSVVKADKIRILDTLTVLDL